MMRARREMMMARERKQVIVLTSGHLLLEAATSSSLRNITGRMQRRPATCYAAGWSRLSRRSKMMQFMTKQKKQDGWKKAWIGLTDEAEEGEWVWSSGKAPSFTNWAPKEPSNHKSKANEMQGEDCVLLNINPGGPKKPWNTPKKWNDSSCSAKHNVICQYEKGGFIRAAVCENK